MHGSSWVFPEHAPEHCVVMARGKPEQTKVGQCI